MDPLSVTASVVTLIAVAGSILQHLEHVRSRLDAQSELLTIMNTVTDLQATLIVVRDEDDALRNSTILAAGLAYKTLPNIIQKLQKRLNELVNFAHANLLRNGKGLPHLGLSARRKKQLVDIRDNISDAHRNLQLVLLSANLCRNRDLLSRIEEAVIVQNQHHAETSASLSRITAQLTTMHDLQVNSSKTTNCKQQEIRSALTQSICEDGNVMSTQLRITTSMPRKACSGTCNCQCHVRTQFQTPKFLSAVVGTLFYSSTNTPSLDVRPCNVKTCLRSQPSSSSRLTYYFPSWMMHTAVVYSMWTSLEGRNSSWFVKMPRVITFDQPYWNYIVLEQEHILRRSLERREISPYDVAQNGSSLLHVCHRYGIGSFVSSGTDFTLTPIQWAVRYGNFRICSLLVTMGADWDFKDRSGKSASDFAWRVILTSQNQDLVIRLRTLVGMGDSHDLCLEPLHQIVCGLSNADLQTQIEMEPSRIDDRGWLGMTPLMWAAARGNLTHLDVLLSRGAQTELNDTDGSTALHLAMKAKSPECVRALLEAGAGPNNVDGDGEVPLQNIRTWKHRSDVEDVILLLCRYGANLDVDDSYGWTPLQKAIDIGSHVAVLALIKNGANVNASGYFDTPPIHLAIRRQNYRIVQLLCDSGAVPFWNQSDGSESNVLESAARFGTAEIMNVLSESAIAPIECNFATLVRLFNRGRYVDDNKRGSPEDGLAAFVRLLEKKAILLDLVEGSDLSVELGKERVEKSSEHYEDDEDDAYDTCRDDEDECQLDDIFEDALESLSLLDEPDMPASSPDVAVL